MRNQPARHFAQQKPLEGQPPKPKNFGVKAGPKTAPTKRPWSKPRPRPSQCGTVGPRRGPWQTPKALGLRHCGVSRARRKRGLIGDQSFSREGASRFFTFCTLPSCGWQACGQESSVAKSVSHRAWGPRTVNEHVPPDFPRMRGARPNRPPSDPFIDELYFYWFPPSEKTGLNRRPGERRGLPAPPASRESLAKNRLVEKFDPRVLDQPRNLGPPDQFVLPGPR